MKVEGVPLEESTIHSLAKVIFSDSAKLYDPEALVRTLFAEIVENDLSPSEVFKTGVCHSPVGRFDY
jgi:hypothetical protein